MRKLFANITFQGSVLAFLLACSGGLAPGGGMPATGEGTAADVRTGGHGVGELPSGSQIAASPEMPEIMVGPGFDGTNDPKAKKVEVRIPADVSLVCQNSNGTPATVTKRVAARFECRFAGTNDPYTPCGRNRYLRIHDAVAKNYIDVTTSEDGGFNVEFTFNLPPQNAKLKSNYSNSLNSSLTDPTASDALGLGSNNGIPSSKVSDETDLTVYAGFYPPDEFNTQKVCGNFCVAMNFFAKLGVYTFPADHDVAGPGPATESCEP